MDANIREREQLEYDNLVNAIAAAQSDSEAGKYQLQQAMATGDYQGAAEAQERIARSQAQLVSLESGKVALDERQDAQTQQQRRYTAADYINAMPNLLPEERHFLMNNPHLVMSDEGQTALKSGFYQSQRAGIQRGTPEYYEHMERYTAHLHPGGSGVPGSRASNIQLTPQQKDAAKIAGISETEYQKQYQRMLDTQHDTRSLYGKYASR
jgi:hypothetical protein